MKVSVIRWSDRERNPALERFLGRPAFTEATEERARRILRDVRDRGLRAVLQWAARVDGVRLTPAQVRVAPEEFEAARRAVDREFRAAARETRRRIMRFCRAGGRTNWRIPTPRGGRVGEQFMPLDRVGVYIPSAAAPLASSALMTATLAKAASVPQIVACTPCGRNGAVNPYLLFALELAGATEVYRVGGVQAIGLMAYGAPGIPRVQKIVGPGGAFVTAAKRLVYGRVALDLVAGPSEIAVLADEDADPAWIAADLLSQAEHGTGWEKALLVTPSRRLARSVQTELERQSATLERARAARIVMRRGMLLVVVPDLASGVALCNRFAPEHLELLVRQPARWLRTIRCAGAVFVGPWTPESAGDFVAGPSHVLPTGGTAAMFSGLTVDDFRRRSSYIEFTRADLADALPVIEAFARIEGLDGHARSARVRFAAGRREPAPRARGRRERRM